MREKGKSLRELERWLERSLREELPLFAPLKVHCAVVKHTFFISVHVIESSDLSPSIVLSLVEKKMMDGAGPPGYSLETYFIVHEKSRFDTLFAPALVPLVPVSVVARAGRLPFPFPRVLALGAVIFSSLITLYCLTRPCSRGTCPELQRVRQLGERAVASWERDPNAARDDISRSLALLKEIPFWSPYRDTALSLEILYRDRARDLARLTALLDRAAAVETPPREDPLSPARWRELRRSWGEILAEMGGFSRDNAFYPYIERKTGEFRQKLSEIDRRFERERGANLQLEEARGLAEIALSRQRTARSPEDLESVEGIWRETLARLRAIPLDTPAGQEARRLTANYLERWTATRGEREREAKEDEKWRGAGDRARRAAGAARENRWSEAVDFWRESLDLLGQISPDSPRRTRVAAAIARYRRALAIARERERIDKDLRQVCSKVTDICSYEIADERIRVYLSAGYVGRIQDTALRARSRADPNLQSDLMNHLSRLESSFQAIADGASRAVEIYNADRVLLSVYGPERSSLP